MKKVWTEVLFDIRKNPCLFLVMIIQLTVCFAVGLFSDLLEKEMDQYRDSVLQEQGESDLYFLTDNLVGEYEKAFFRSEDAVAKLKIMYSLLTNDDRFEYLEMYNNPIVLIGENIKDEVLYRYEAGETEKYRAIENGEIYNEVKCFWMSCNVGDVFNFQCQEGSLWSEEEKNGQPIPIVLGSDYQGMFEVGNIINGLSPVADKVQLEVHGILEEGQWVTYKGRILNLDRYVLIPLQDARTMALTNVEKWNQRMLYLFKINGTLRSKLSANELEDIVQGICDTCGVYPASVVSGSTNMQGYIINIDIQDVLVLLKRMLIMLNVFSGIAAVLYVIMKIDKNKEYYSILILNGFSVGQIMSIILISLALLLAASEAISVFLYSLFSFVLFRTTELSLVRMAVYDAVYVVAIGVISYIKLIKMDVSFYLGGNR